MTAMLRNSTYPTEDAYAMPIGNAGLSIAALDFPRSHARSRLEESGNLLPAAPIPAARGGLPPRALRRVREYIASHLKESLTIRTLADNVGLSTCHFARAFKQSQGMSPHRYLLQCRVRRTQELLATTDLPLSEIALASGFSDQSHFARQFRQHVGVTPSTYRWSMR
jgi:transcriptional regulator GlxA family with amidase domain